MFFIFHKYIFLKELKYLQGDIMSSMMEIKLSENLNLLMKEQNLKQTVLAKKIGVSQSAISAWLLEKKEPSITSLWKLADFFDVSIDELIGRKLF